jgi:hypothetical protein
MSKLYREVFNPERARVFAKLSAFAKDGVLAGGTGLALQLGHRQSFDFDIFVSQPLGRSVFRKITRIFGKKLTTRISNPELLIFTTLERVEINFVYFEFKLLYPPVKTESISLASIKDIAADKAYTVGKRGQWRDYVDLFFLLKDKYLTLETVIENAQKKYRPEFNPRLFLEQLSYFGDIKDFAVSFLRNPYSPKEIQQFLTDQAKKFLFTPYIFTP